MESHSEQLQHRDAEEASNALRKTLGLGVGALYLSAAIATAEVTDVMPDAVPGWGSAGIAGYIAIMGGFSLIVARSIHKDSKGQAMSDFTETPQQTEYIPYDAEYIINDGCLTVPEDAPWEYPQISKETQDAIGPILKDFADDPEYTKELWDEINRPPK